MRKHPSPLPTRRPAWRFALFAAPLLLASLSCVAQESGVQRSGRLVAMHGAPAKPYAPAPESSSANPQKEAREASGSRKDATVAPDSDAAATPYLRPQWRSGRAW